MSRAWAAVIVIVAAAACAQDRSPAADEPTPEPLAMTPTLQNDTARKPGYVGVLAPREEAVITAPFTTDVDQYLVNLGDVVDIGVALAKLDEAPLQEQIAVARAELKASQADATQASVSRAAAKEALRREQKGIKEGIASKADLSEAEFKSREAGAGVARAAATVEQQKARIAALENKLEHMTLTSPIAGKVATRYVEAGHRVDEGRPVIRVITSEDLFVKFVLPTDERDKVKPGDTIDLVIEDIGAAAKAKVTSVAPELDPIAHVILAEAELVAPLPGKLQSGMVCRIAPPVVQMH